LIEVMVALMVFVLLITGTTALLTSALRGLMLSRADTVGKNLTQEGMEGLRNLPFFVSATVPGGSPDLLDRYYPNTSVLAVGKDGSGYVPASVPLTGRAPEKGDPSTGPFHRTVIPTVSADARYATYSQRIAVQLLSDEGAVVASPAFVAQSQELLGKQPATLVGVTVTTSWQTGGANRNYSLYSRIADGDVRTPVVTLQARLAALRVTGLLPGARELLVEAGIVNLDGSLSSSTVSSASAQGAKAAISGTEVKEGAQAAIIAPPTGARATVNETAQTLRDDMSTVMSSGTPALRTSAPASPPASRRPHRGRTGDRHRLGQRARPVALTADNRPSTSTRLKLAATPMIRLDGAFPAGGACAAIRGRAYLESVGGGSHAAAAAMTTSMTGVLKLCRPASLPTA
jgi:hypothetical protein